MLPGTSLVWHTHLALASCICPQLWVALTTLLVRQFLCRGSIFCGDEVSCAGMGWMTVSLQNACWNPNPQWALGGGTFGKPGGAGNGSFICGIRALLKRPEGALLFCHSKSSSMNQEAVLTRHQICQHLDFGLPVSRTLRNTFMWSISQPVYDILLWLFKLTMTITSVAASWESVTKFKSWL
jgi:hypothetical protein